MSTYEETRNAIAGASRVVVKVGSSSLTTPTGLNTDALEKIARTLAKFRLDGKEVILVSSGAVAAGMGPMKAITRPKDLATQQAAAGIGQGILMSSYFTVLAEYGLVPAQVLLTADELIRRTQYRNAQRAIDRMLALGFMPIVNENDAVATSEIRLGTTTDCPRLLLSSLTPMLWSSSPMLTHFTLRIQRTRTPSESNSYPTPVKSRN